MSQVKILFLGDVMGREGRDVVLAELPNLKQAYTPDVIIVNCDNAAGGFGITKSICQDFYQAGVDILTGGNHIWDQKEVISHINADPKLLRPMNYINPKTPGRGVGVINLPSGQQIVVLHALGTLFMEQGLTSPFYAIDEALKTYPLSHPNIAAVFVDFHAEATSEKAALAHYLDGRVSSVMGSHTHVPTADARILPGGTAFMTDVGMCGPFDSIIGMSKESSLHRFLGRLPRQRLEVGTGPATLHGICITVAQGKATAIETIRRGRIWHS